MQRKKIDDLLELYDKYAKENYKMSFNELCEKFHINEDALKNLKKCNGETIIKRKIVTPENKKLLLAITIGRPEAFKRLWEKNIFNYDDIAESIRFLPPCLTQIPHEMIEDKDFNKAVFSNNKTITAMFNNANYVPETIYSRPSFKRSLIVFFDKILNHLEKLNGYDFVTLLYFPDYLRDVDVYQKKVLSIKDDIIARIKKDQSFIHRCPKFLIDDEEFFKKYVEIFDINYFDKLPGYVITKKDIRLKCNRTNRIFCSNKLDKKGYDADWLNENGELRQYFTLQNSFPINSREDYDKIYRAYIDSHLSIKNFCIRFGITPITGFKEFIKRIGDENYGKNNEIDNISNSINEKYFNLCSELASKVIYDEITFEEFLTNPDLNFFVTNINYFYNTILGSDVNERHDFIVKIIEYIERNSYCLHQHFIAFLSGNENNFLANYSNYLYHGLNHDKNVLPKHTKLKKVIEAQNKIRGYENRDLYSKTTKNGIEYVVDEDIVNKAIAYVDENHINPCYKALELVCKQITTGEIIYDKEIERKKSDRADVIISLLEQAKSMEEYLNIMGNKLETYSKQKKY